MKATILATSKKYSGNHPAPKTWEEIPEIKKAKPNNSKYEDVSLQEMTGSKGIVQWWVYKMGRWLPFGPLMKIKQLGT